MTRHIIEQTLTAGFMLLACWAAWHGNWAQGQFWLMCAVLTDLDDFVHGGKND